MSEFKDKVVVVTGAGGGLGRSHALEFARRGARVVVNDLGGSTDGVGSGDMADTVVQEIRDAGGEAIANKASVSDRDGAKSIIDDAVSAYGTVDILVNNAGILRDKSFKKMTLDDWDLLIDVHLNGTAYVTHAAWPIMYEQNYGRILLTSSVSGILGNFGQANYGAAKTGMLGLAFVLAQEGAAHNIRVNVLSPGAATRLTNTVPGRDEDLDNPDPLRSPEMVTPAVFFMCQGNAPTGKVIHAHNGKFSMFAIFNNEGLDLGLNSSFEALEENRDKLLDMSEAIEGRFGG
ncbi:MAG: SDR family NAD(P)-dependent oxidoreductase [Pseudomonadales bacterium]|jgi:NAD(P)-dependent dehydrogenase (short-subunit alcohol dehydrogenase family)|nr:SDR family NAD(P)-dependent oxidoreductase [Pseudomonadales bacterium]MDP6470012.1 SDR family NAD(P)-dependent oxidoreductase [Pseudomonadales bacterium]MDP6826912.1 SDR family NAD(P)-dependent oxidoreductase [Pseudomonadales bacterium]|tara:strand:+ start:3063 stop:3932 length:870 start_codon:yes stop_codon:yes gene_type:complete